MEEKIAKGTPTILYILKSSNGLFYRFFFKQINGTRKTRSLILYHFKLEKF